MSQSTGWRAYLQKMRGAGRTPLKVSPGVALFGGVGGFVTIVLLGILTQLTPTVWLMAPFGASCVLAFVVWDSPLSQPRNIIGGHVLSSLVGVVMFQLFGSGLWVVALGVGIAIALMHLTKTTHPPAGADPVVIILAGSGWSFLVAPVLVGAVMVVVVATIVNNLHGKRRYPLFWM